jgi:DNA-binding response OmpR family regulator
MRLLIVDSSVKDRDATIRLLPVDTHEIRVARDAAEALSILENAEFDLLLVEMSLVGTSGAELVKRIRAREASGHMYIIMTAARHVPGDLRVAFQVGADDFVRKPLVRDELLLRMEAPTRIRRWAAKVLGGGSADFQARSELTSLGAWASADSALSSELADMLGFALNPAFAESAIDGASHVATLPLSLAGEQAEVSLAIGVDGASAAALAEALLGSPDVDPAAIADMMRELANVAAGAFKRMAATEGRVLTTGLPAESSAEMVRESASLARKQWVATVEGSPIVIRFELQLRVREPKRVRVAGLREGMVLANDLRNPLGALLMPSGTRICESHVAGIRRQLGEEHSIEVMEAA